MSIRFSKCVVHLLNVLFLLQLLLLLAQSSSANDDISGELAMKGTQQFFRRNAKWINLPSGGGSLVSGRGNFRPGFHSATRYRAEMAEPLFAFKRSYQPMDVHQLLFEGNPLER